jgi:Domain of unknown function (DU1801)
MHRAYSQLAGGATSGRHHMAATTNKTVPTQADVDAFIEAVGDEKQRDDARQLVTLMSRLSGHPPRLWGPSIIGFGSYHYRYESGREGDMCRIGFSPRKGQTVLYLVDGYEQQQEHLAQLGKHKLGKSCLYIKRLSDINLETLEAMVTASLAAMAVKYPD